MRVWLVASLVAVTFCAASAAAAGDVRLVSHSIGTGVGAAYPYQCTNQKSVFSSADARVYVQVRVSGCIYENEVVRWEWYSPLGLLPHMTYTYKTDPPDSGCWKNYSAYAWMGVAGNPSSGMPGMWHVDVYWGRQLVHTERFEVRSAGALPPIVSAPSTKTSIFVTYTDGVAYVTGIVKGSASALGELRIRFEVDSGAAITTLPGRIASQLGIPLRSGTPIELTDVSGTKIQGWVHWVQVTLLGDAGTALAPVRIRVAFVERDDSPYLLGRLDVLDLFAIALSTSGFTVSAH
jgi:hypothetical protein